MGGGLSRQSGSGYRYGCPPDGEDDDDDNQQAACPWIGRSLALPPKPFKLDAHFQLHSVLGTGMLGRVRLVQHKASRKFFALKSMRKADVAAHNMLAQVEREREAFATALRGAPFLAACFGSLQTASHVHLVLEYAPGGELRRRLHQAGGTFSPDEAKFYAAELVVFVAACHARGCIYRDLKPENVLLDARGHVKVVDLGFVKRLRSDAERCATSLGTPQYLAPEQLTPSRERRSYARAVDWWALACVLFEMVAGHTPFASRGSRDSDSPFEVYTRIVQGRVQWPRPALPAPLKDLLRRMLEPDEATRLCDADAVKRHAWFADVDWQEVERGEVAPPFRPKLRCEGDRACFDEYPEESVADKDAGFSAPAGKGGAMANEFRNF